MCQTAIKKLICIFFLSYKSSDCPEMLSTILGSYKMIVASTSPSDDELPKLPLQVIQVHIVPPLQKLASEFKNVFPVQETCALQLIGQLEASYGRTFVLHLPQAATARTFAQRQYGSSSLLTPPPSIDEMKIRVGKIFQKPSQSFWKI